MAKDPPPIPDEDQICKCGHSLARHIRVGSSGTDKYMCIEQFCTCGDFKLNNVK